MEKAYRILKTAVWCVVGVFAGTSVYTLWDFWQHPESYIYSSAPWYTGIEVNGIFAAVLILLLLIPLFILKHKIKNRGE